MLIDIFKVGPFKYLASVCWILTTLFHTIASSLIWLLKSGKVFTSSLALAVFQDRTSCVWLMAAVLDGAATGHLCHCRKLFSEKAMAPHSSTLAWRSPWTENPRRLQSMGLLRVRHDWATSLSLFTLMHWRRKWQPTSVFLPGESWGQRSLVGCRLWGRTESDTTEVT